VSGAATDASYHQMMQSSSTQSSVDASASVLASIQELLSLLATTTTMSKWIKLTDYAGNGTIVLYVR